MVDGDRIRGRVRGRGRARGRGREEEWRGGTCLLT